MAWYHHFMPRSQNEPNRSSASAPFKLDAETKERVKRLVDARQRTSHWLMREAISQYVEREERCEALRQDGLRAWQEYQTTGVHVAAAEADAWLAKLEQGQETEPPRPDACAQMTNVIWLPAAPRDVQGLHWFLAERNRDAASRAVKSIREGVKNLAQRPGVGRPAGGMEPEFREWMISFWDSSYVALYRFDVVTAVILAVRYQRVAGY